MSVLEFYISLCLCAPYILEQQEFVYRHAVNLYAYGIPNYYIYQCRVHAHNYELYHIVTLSIDLYYPTIVQIVLM